MKSFNLLYKRAHKVSPKRKLSDSASCGGVGSALVTGAGKTYTGLCINTHCGLGFCAEHSAVAEMLKNGESEIKEIIAVDDKKKILPPCGRCRELILQINARNKETVVHLSKTKHKKIKALLPESYTK